MSQYKVLVIDDNKAFLSSVKTVLSKFIVFTACSLSEARSKISNDIDIILLDLVFDESQPDNLQGMDYLKEITQSYPDLQIIIMTNYSSTDITVTAIKLGATDFLNKKELDWTEWKIRIENYCKQSARIRQLSENYKKLESKYGESEIVGVSKQIDYIRRRLKDLAQNSNEVSILISGETGTGKNLAVKYFQKYSLRKNKSFKDSSLIELSETILESELFGHIKGSFTDAVQDRKGLFEEAEGGILFLDEIGDYDLKTQKKIMRFIEEKIITPVGSSQSKKLDLQLIMATNQELRQLISAGKFREDLYQRINRVKIELPPLRDRKEDIIILTDYFFKHFKEEERTNLNSIDSQVYVALENYCWPGNIRELQSVIWDACTRARLFNDNILTVTHIRSEILQKKDELLSEGIQSPNISEKVAIAELEEIDKALGTTQGNKTEAAKILKLNLDQVRYLIVKNIDTHDYLLKEFNNIKKYYSYLFKMN